MTNPATIVTVGSDAGAVQIGNHLPISFFCGPCAMESREHALETAHWLKETYTRLGVGLVYKSSFDKANRSSLTGARGFGLDKAMAVFEEIQSKLGLPVITDVHTEEQCRLVGQVVDVLQIPAFLCRQTDLLIAAAQTGKAINIKKGQFLAPWDMKHVIAKVTGSGNPNVLVTERGASFGYNTLVTDFRGLPIMAAFGAPVVFDATHSVQQPGGRGDSSGGDRTMVKYLARAAAAVGVAAIFMESHPDPDKAPSDGPNMVPFAELEAVLASIIAHDKITKGY
ncbi:3-deoxy-8-phosphooctulonate synthase [Candidatus Phycosocius spiralis]|uniref:2-dehydro-3-deoxyphosphooctonate aldolase n=1 Tax=Candidatus Phycosocius spiralis TaxID=2815099 RepID=A0ABQ4PU81_9PROT|nr:3-deoxy-8-phosphooctulonate synthase [Candidatus Phycosocius spiralis]GIU66550.1 2-dehydro-3-deoxyphosphooctonate aldolase [Candidatus Phycosocius spiralis]